MFFQSKLFKFLLPLSAYILFAIIWAANYKEVWYNNVPEETQYLKGGDMGFYMIYAYLFFASFILFLIFGVIYLLKNPVSKLITYILLVDLLFSAYYVWHFSTIPKGWQSNGSIVFVNLALFAFSIYTLVAGKKAK